MLDEYKQLYKECADLIPNWKSIDRNELCRYYVLNKDKLSDKEKEGYFSAIIYKFWNLISFTYNKQQNKIILSVEECYELLIESIIYVLNEAVWEKETSSLFNDIKAPEKAISIRLKSISGNEKHLNLSTNKKKINYLAYSLDQLEEIYPNNSFLNSIDNYNLLDEYLDKIIREFFDKKDYFMAFFIDTLYNFNIYFSDNKNDFIDIKKYIRHLHKISDDYLVDFSIKYGLKLDRVKNAFTYLRYMPSYRIHFNINRAINLLKHDNYLHSLLKD